MMIKKIVIAAAGKGTRMLDLTKDRPKHLIEVNGQPFIFHLLNRIKAAGFTEVIIVIGYQKEIMEQVLNGWPTNLKITIVNQKVNNQPNQPEKHYGTAVPVEIIKDQINKENFAVAYGDSLWSVNDLKKMMIDDDLNYVAGLTSQTPEKYGVLIMDSENFLIKILEKPAEYVGNLINTGLYKFTPEIFNKIPLINKSIRNEYELTDALNLLAAEHRVKVRPINDYWHDFGRPEDIDKVSDFLKNNPL